MAAHACPVFYFPQKRTVHPKDLVQEPPFLLETGLGGNNPQAFSCAHENGPNPTKNPSTELSKSFLLRQGSPWGEGPLTCFEHDGRGALPACNLAEQFELKTLVLKHNVTGKFGVRKVVVVFFSFLFFFGQYKLS